MHIETNKLYHIYNQGNNKQTIFNDRNDYILFLKMVREKIYPFCHIISYCLMPNHYHFLIDTTDHSVQKLKLGSINITALSNGFRLSNSAYSARYNKKYQKSGSLFRQKTKAKLLERTENGFDYPYICFQYIHQNPLKAGLVNKMEDWEYSSFRDYAGLRNGTLVNKDIAYKLIDIDASQFYNDSYAIIADNLTHGIFEQK